MKGIRTLILIVSIGRRRFVKKSMLIRSVSVVQPIWFAIQSVPEFPPEIDFVSESEEELPAAPSEVPQSRVQNLVFEDLLTSACPWFAD